MTWNYKIGPSDYENLSPYRYHRMYGLVEDRDGDLALSDNWSRSFSALWAMVA